MKKVDVINQIIENLKNDDGTFIMLPINGIVPINERVNKRFRFIVAQYISVRIENGVPTLYYLDDESGCGWFYRNLKMNVLNDILSFAKEYIKPKVYVVTKSDAYDYEEYNDVVLVTTDKEKAYNKLNDLREEIRELADEKEYVFDDGETSVEAYEEGYAAQNHCYATLYVKNLV